MSGSSKRQERWGRCAAMDPDNWADFLKTATRADLENLLRRYEWLVEFVMAAPDCARQDEQAELLRRIEVLRQRLGSEQDKQANSDREVEDYKVAGAGEPR